MVSESATMMAMMALLLTGTCAWWTNMCISCDLKPRLDAPFGGLISDGVAKGRRSIGRIRLIATAIATVHGIILANIII